MKTKALSTRTIFCVALFFVAFAAHAQTLDSLAHHNLGPHSAQTTSFMEMSDGSLLGGINMADEYPFVPIGYLLQKVSRTDSGLKVTDSVLFPEEVFWHLTAKDPQGEGYIHLEVANDSENESSFLLIRHFDDYLNYDTTETVVGLEQFTVKCGDPGIILTPDGDIVISYYRTGSSSNVEYNFARIGLDGTIKQKVANDSIYIRAGFIRGPILFSENPLRYCWWGNYYDNAQAIDYVNVYVLDSLFNITSSYTLPDHNSTPGYYVFYSSDGVLTKFLGLEEGCFLAAMPYNRPYQAYPHIEDDGVMVVKYDADFNQLEYRKFLSEPYYQNLRYCARPIGFGHSDDDNIFFAYFTNTWKKESRVSVVKMDNNLNVIWQRHCLDNVWGRDYGRMIVLDDNSVAVTGINITYTSNGLTDHTEAFYLIVHDDYDALEEQGIIVRPYAYYPNPAQNELHLQFSPDVTPSQIELYDLQGRLVRSQRNGLESINMEGLASGTYTMRVTLDGGKVFSDTVIKE